MLNGKGEIILHVRCCERKRNVGGYKKKGSSQRLSLRCGKKMDLKVWSVWGVGEGWGKTTDRKGSLRSKISQTLGREKDTQSGQNRRMTLEELNAVFLRDAELEGALLWSHACYGS